MPDAYHLEVNSETARRTSARWLKLGIWSLVLAGVFSILLVLARTPAIQHRIPLLDFFHVALVVHVNLSVLVWLLAIAGVCWSLGASRDYPRWDGISFWLAVAGTALMVISPFLGAGDPLMNNYVPILRHPLFYAGLGAFAVGVCSHLARISISWRRPKDNLTATDALRTGILFSAILTGMAFLSFLASLAGMPTDMDGQVYFEFLFWGGGHVLQFAYTLLMLIAWIVLASNSGCRFMLTPRLTMLYLLMAALPVITVPFLYLAHEVVSPGHRLAFTELMKYGGLSCLPAGIAVLAAMWKGQKPTGEQRYLRASLESSVGLFAVGGVLGFLIAGLDIVIPAHYHGSTVGVTLAFMGLIYYLLPRLGFRAPHQRMAVWQPYVYGGGQLLHILGLAWTGGYGVQRKTAGVAQGVDRLGEIAGMGLMGLGGLISVIGGLMFLIIAIRAMWKVKPQPVAVAQQDMGSR
jgi:heme/copper-type cytochrome/quinol oxidase subunit 1